MGRSFRSKLHVMVKPSSSPRDEQDTNLKLAMVDTLKKWVQEPAKYQKYQKISFTIGL
jgi:hypothetical protein